MDKLLEIKSNIKKYYIETSMEYGNSVEPKKALQTIGICLLYFENSIEDKYVIRDTRNLIYDLMKNLSKDEKKLIKPLLKIIK